MSASERESDRFCYEGRERYIAGDVDGAVEMYRKGLHADPSRKNRWNDLGSMLKDAGRYDEAAPCFWRAIEIDVRYGDAWFNLGVVYLRRQGKPNDGLTCLLKAVQCNSHDREAISYAAEALTDLGRIEDATQFLSNPNAREMMTRLRANAHSEAARLAEREGFPDLARRLSSSL